MDSCPFKNLLGESGKGIHSIRVFGLAAVDVLLTVLLAYLTKGNRNFFLVLLFWVTLGIILHRVMCVDTTIGNLIFRK
jgi:hypothetical protein